MRDQFHGTTILAVRRGGSSVIAGDGQLTLEDTVIKSSGRKVRKLFDGKILVGYAGGAADALALLDVFETKLKQYNGDLTRSVIEVAKEWRLNRDLRRLEAELIVMDAEKMFLLSGLGEVVEPDDDVVALGSGGTYALAAARALMKHTTLSTREIALEAMKIAAQICVYTNEKITVEELE
ncbi:ATP-dependent protease subunit HslV [bacterium]|nr:ATP-dependent protease subunit HslV [bacterium]MBU1983972.1 ATP-dependent protease subunit HslV [bacterium]